MRMPLNNPRITSGFKSKARPNHLGVDMVSADHKVYAAEGGRAERRYDDISGYGVNIYSGNRKWEYIHLNAVGRAGNGATVAEGELIGNYYPGSGKINGAHLHFGLQIPHNGPQVDAYAYVLQSKEDMYDGKTAEQWYQIANDWHVRADDRQTVIKRLENEVQDLKKRVADIQTALDNEKNKPPREVIKEVEKIVEKPVDEKQVVEGFFSRLWASWFKR